MTLTSIVGIILIGLAAGLLGSMVGIGGGIVIVPSLILLLGLSQHEAQGTSLALMSFPVSLVAAYTYHQKGFVDWKIALLLCLGFVVGGFFGSRMAVNISPIHIKRVFAIFLIFIAFKFLFIDKK